LIGFFVASLIISFISKGFGFIVEEGSKKEHFVHISGLVDEVREGDNVEFDLQEGRKGLNAVNVKVI
jgi:CspA family cold shock protein